MAHSYLPVDRDQQFLLPPDVRDWLPESHLAWFVIDVIAAMDTSALHDRHPLDGVGRRAYDPEMMLTLLVYAYCVGYRSSRQIERLCESDTAFRVISANRAPDHTTIARFRQDCESLMADLFIDVLMVCREAGLASVGVVALDGTKMGADASLEANRSRRHIAGLVDTMMAEAEAEDAAQDTLFGDTRGDELPAGLDRHGRDRLERLQECVRQIDAERDVRTDRREASNAKADAEAVAGRKMRGPKRGDADPVTEAERGVVRAKAKAARRQEKRAETEARAAAKGRKPRGPAPDSDCGVRDAEADYEAAKAAAADESAAGESSRDKRQGNVTDPDSRIMKTRKGWVQGYNAQAVVNDNQIVLGVDVTQAHNDLNMYTPMIDATRANLDAVGIDGPIGLVLGDAGYCSESNLTAPGPDRLIATMKCHKQRKAARELGTTVGPPPPDAAPIDAMEHRLRTVEGAERYARRSVIVEPVFGQTKSNRGIDRFMRRGLHAVRSEWHLITASHNLLKAFNSGHQPGQ